MKRRLGMTSGEFLEKYTLMPVHKDMKTPVVMLRMNDDEAKTCPFLTDAGCGVYADRPWPCRMYPLGLAAQKDTPDGWRGERFYFLLAGGGVPGVRRAAAGSGRSASGSTTRGSTSTTSGASSSRN